MNSKEVKRAIDSVCGLLFRQYPQIVPIVSELCRQDATVFLVGGAVRDAFLGRQIKDFDIEVHHISIEQLQNVLATYGSVDIVGKSFGVLRLFGLDIDWSVCRMDASGRRPEVSLDPYMDPKQAFARRDVTINAMGINVCNKTLYDPFGGLDHLKKGVLSAPDQYLFKEDPLRFFRVMQFISRFECYPDEALEETCRTMSLSEISRERIEQEWHKMMLQSRRPSLGVRWLQSIGRLSELLPHLAATKGVPQRADYHPEGDVFEHSMQACDAAAALSYDSSKQKLLLCYAALFHDIGKTTTTQLEDGILRSPEHAEIGARYAEKDLSRILCSKKLIRGISKLIHYHMHPGNFVSNQAKQGAYKRLAHHLWPLVTIQEISLLFTTDRQGRNPDSSLPLTNIPEDVQIFIATAQKAGVFNKPEVPVVSGTDLLAFMEPGPLLGNVLERVYDIQISTGIQNKDMLLKRARDIYRSLSLVR